MVAEGNINWWFAGLVLGALGLMLYKQSSDDSWEEKISSIRDKYADL